MRVALAAVLLLSACEPAPQPPGPTVSQENATADQSAHMAAERECAGLTGYAAEKFASMTSEMRALVTREYKSCVAEVGGR